MRRSGGADAVALATACAIRDDGYAQLMQVVDETLIAEAGRRLAAAVPPAGRGLEFPVTHDFGVLMQLCEDAGSSRAGPHMPNSDSEVGRA